MKELAIEFISTNNLTGLKAGNERDTFLNIWMVVVNNRIFARSWGLAERGWYNTFLQNPEGSIKCGEKIIQIKAIVPGDIKELTESINKAYLDKYDFGENSFYANGIIKPQHIERTMEFIPG
jgi:hypothetical protein